MNKRYFIQLIILTSFIFSLPAISQSCPLVIDSSHTDVSCYFSYDGAINISVSNGVEPYTFDWDDDQYDGMSDLTFIPGGTYVVIISDAADCRDTLTFVVTEPEPFVPDCSEVVFPSGPLATDGEVDFSFIGGKPPFTIEWLDNDLNVLGTVNTSMRSLLIDQLPADNIAIRVIDSDGCVTTCTASLLKNTCQLILGVDMRQNVCPDDEQGSIELISQNGVEPIQYDWNIDDYDGMSLITGLSSGEYSVTAVDAIGCDTSLTFQIEPPHFWEISCRELMMQSDINTIDGAIEITLDSVWFPITVTSMALDTMYTIDEPVSEIEFYNLRYGFYDISIIDSAGCELTCNAEVTIDLPRPQFYIPSAFSPNQDGTNDFFQVYTNGGITEIESFSIYDRWGTRVYETFSLPADNNMIGWDGTFKGLDLNPATFTYKVTMLTFTDERLTVTGTVELLR